MNLLFSNRMERQVDEGRVEAAQVSIFQEQSGYRSVWQPAGLEDGDPQLWYEGDSREELMADFRFRIAGKLGEGFVPLIADIPGIEGRRKDEANTAGMLLFYSESRRNEQLFQELRTWRRSKASEAVKPPYFVAGNRLLTLISALIPHNEQELAQIPGFGQHKIRHYGAEVLAITGKYEQTAGFPLDWIAGAVDGREFRNWSYKQQEQKYKAEAEKLERKTRMLQEVTRGIGMDELCKSLKQSRRDIAIMAEQLEAEGYDIRPLIEREWDKIAKKERDKLLQLFSQHGDKWLKPVLEKGYSPEQLEGTDLQELYTRLRIVRLYYRSSGRGEDRRIG